MNGLSLLPTVFVDMAGSLACILFAFLALRHAYQLTKRVPDNFLWSYLFYTCLAIAAFSISRAAGHIVKQLLLITDHAAIWHSIAPWSGGFNTLLMISVSAVTLYYHKGIQAYEAIEHKNAKLKYANDQLRLSAEELTALNLSLEEKVEERTAELSKSERKYRHMFSASKDMVFFCDARQQVIEINQSGIEMLGYDPEHPPNLTLFEIFHKQGDLETHASSIRYKGYVKDMEVEFEKQDGSVIYVLLSASAVYGEDLELIGCEGIAKDLTRVKTMMQQLVSSEKMVSVGQMAAGVAHEINTPLGIILGYAQLLKDDFEEGSEPYQSLEVIERQTKASRKIVADLLKFSRQTESERINLNLNEVIADVVAVTEHNLNLDHIRVHTNLEEQLPLAVGDAEKLRQVVVNLINNAHHAMEETGGGDLFLSTSHQPEEKNVTLEVRDTGHGIPKEVMASIFDPFFTTKPVGKGTGLGLSVSYGIMQDHGGTIEVESPVKGKGKDDVRPGTSFRLVLPAAGQNEPPVIT
jgi:PAS domain S-box-containing protein